MSTLFDDLTEGLTQAIDYVNEQQSSACTVTYRIDPVLPFISVEQP